MCCKKPEEVNCQTYHQISLQNQKYVAFFHFINNVFKV